MRRLGKTLLAAAAAIVSVTACSAAAVDEQSYENVLRDRITGPLAMNDTALEPSTGMRVRLASGYDAKLHAVSNEDLGASGGAGGLYSTVNDLLSFVDPRVTVAKAHRWITVSAKVLDRYVGRYKFEDSNHLTVTRQANQLIVQLTGRGPIEVFPTTPCEFSPRDIEAQFVFADAGGSLVPNQDGQGWRADRVSGSEAVKQATP